MKEFGRRQFIEGLGAFILSPTLPTPVPTGSAEGPNLTVTDASACVNEHNQIQLYANIRNDGLRVVSEKTQTAGVIEIPDDSFDSHVVKVETPSLIPAEGISMSWTSDPLPDEVVNNATGWYVEADWEHRIDEMGQGDYDNTFFGSALKKCTSIIRRLWLPQVIK